MSVRRFYVASQGDDSRLYSDIEWLFTARETSSEPYVELDTQVNRAWAKLKPSATAIDRLYPIDLTDQSEQSDRSDQSDRSEQFDRSNQSNGSN